MHLESAYRRSHQTAGSVCPRLSAAQTRSHSVVGTPSCRSFRRRRNHPEPVHRHWFQRHRVVARVFRRSRSPPRRPTIRSRSSCRTAASPIYVDVMILPNGVSAWSLAKTATGKSTDAAPGECRRRSANDADARAAEKEKRELRVLSYVVYTTVNP